MISKRKKSETFTKGKTLKQLRREWEGRERYLKNVSDKLSKKYSKHYNENNAQLKKINLDFMVSEKQPTKQTMDPIEKLSGLYIYPRIYATFKQTSENSKPKMREMGVTPGILLESIIYPFFELHERDINKITIEENINEPCRYDIIDDGRIIYIKLHKKDKVKLVGNETGALLRYLNNKDYFDELIFNKYIEQFKKQFDVLKIETSIKKSDHSPVLKESNYKDKELRIALCNTPGFYGVELGYGPENSGYSILYSIPKYARLSEITSTIMKAIPEIESYCKSTGRNPSEIPIINKKFTHYNYFEIKLKKLLKELPDNHRNENKD